MQPMSIRVMQAGRVGILSCGLLLSCSSVRDFVACIVCF